MPEFGRSPLRRSLSSIGRQVSYRQPVRPFISSTFLDFSEERDHLVKRIFPQLHSLCHQRGSHFSPVDLRWGINEEQSQSGHVISLCLDYVNSCSPFFICLLGERYGSHRPQDAKPLQPGTDMDKKDLTWLDKNYLVAAANGHNWVLQEAYQCCSVTELEIIQAAYLNDSQYCRFYFRDVRHIEDKFTDLSQVEREGQLQAYRSENAKTELLVRDLKRRLVNKGLPVRFFRTTEELGEKVLQDWKSIIDQLFPPLHDVTSDVDSEQFHEWMAHEAYAETRRRVFVQTSHISELFEQLDAHGILALEEELKDCKVQQEGCGSVNGTVKGRKPIESVQPVRSSILTLVGERGCGKTAIVANWVQHFKKSSPGLRVLAHFVGSSALSTDITSFLRRVTYELRGEFVGNQNETSGDTEDMSNFHHICEAFVAAVAMGPCVLVLDGIDELSGTLGQSMHQVKEMSWLPATMPPQCQIILTTVRSDLTYKTLSQRGDTQVLPVPLFKDKGQKSAMVANNLAIHCKCLDRGQMEKVVTSKLSDRPLFLSILANELRVCGTYRNLDKVLEQYVEAATFRDLWKCVIHRWIRDYGWTTDGRSTSASSDSSLEDMSGWVAEVLRLISCSRNGLSEPEILELLRMMGYTGEAKVTPFDFALFRSATFDALVERPGGLMSFFHQHLREAVEHSLLGMISGTAGLPDSPNASAVNFLTVGLNRQKRRCHEALASYFLKQPHSLRRTGELPWQLEKCGDIQSLYNILTEPQVFLMMSQDSIQSVALKLDLLRYWQRLGRNGYNIAEAYEKMVTTARAAQESALNDSGGNSTNGTIAVASSGSSRPESGGKVLQSPFKKPRPKLSVIEESVASDSPSPSPVKTSEMFISEVTITCEADTTTYSSISVEQDMTASAAWNVKESMVSASQKHPTTASSSKRSKNRTTPNAVRASSSSDTDEGEVWEDARDGTEPHSDEDKDIFYEFKPQDRCKLAVLAMHAGKVLAEKSCFMQSERLLQLAYEEIKTKFPLSTPEHQLLVKVEENLGDLHRFQLHKNEAKKFYCKALDTLSNIAANKSDDIYRQLQESQGRLLTHLGHMAVKEYRSGAQEAETILQKASQCMRGANSIAGLATAQFILGLVQVKKSDYLAAEKCLLEALGTRERWYGKSHPHVGEVLDELGGLLSNTKNLQRYDRIMAEAHFRRALLIRTQSFGRDHLLVGTSLFHLGRLLKCSGSQQCKTEAVTLLGRAQDIRTTHLGANHFLTKAVRQALKEVQQQLTSGDYDYAPVKQPDRRTKQRPYSALSWHEADLMGFEKQARAKSAQQGVERSDSKAQQTKTDRRRTSSHVDLPSTPKQEESKSHDSGGVNSKARSNSVPNIRDGATPLNRDSAPPLAGKGFCTEPEQAAKYNGKDKGVRSGQGAGKSQRPRSVHGTFRSGQRKPGRKAASANSPVRAHHTEIMNNSARTQQRERQGDLQSLCLIPRQNARGDTTAPLQGVDSAPNSKDAFKRFSTWSAGTYDSWPRSTQSRGQGASSAGERGTSPGRRPYSSSSQVSHTSHRSRCDVPSALQMHPSNDRTIRGPHSQIQAILGEPSCPRPVQPKVLHTSAWWHEPGGYPRKPNDIYPPRRHQKRPASRPPLESSNRFSVLASMADNDN
ncbi:uncharacterized protein LOC110983816 isoform X2 [Acanthaster planci]|uniref:Uncharacterized protein LOC110983816 isoform X2 n=1 Tax=Acanthaster planci TaxID=133434 RepID=A0A8B7Z0G1_ACAPL|nr:uncharacterized protein LOC110983816 isoform X2 [Acanthaster planci]